MLNVAIVGAGVMGRVHGSAFKSIGGARVSAVCDIDEERAREAAAVHNARVWSDFEGMLDQEEIDVVDICLPTHLHKDFAVGAMRRGKHVFCEKPIASSEESAGEMLREAVGRGVKLSVGQVVRYFPPYARAAAIVSEGKIGTPKLIRTTRTGAFPLQGRKSWYSDHELSGGVLLDLVIHDFDWIRHNFGEVERVYAKNLARRGSEQMDHCLVSLRLRNGAIAHVEGSWAYPLGSVFGSTFEIVGTKGQLEFDSRASVPVRKHILTEGSEKIFTDSPVFSREEPYTAELREFISCIEEGREPSVSARDAIKALKISTAAIESAKTGEAVTLGGEVQ